jgi:hypothetical protein
MGSRHAKELPNPETSPGRCFWAFGKPRYPAVYIQLLISEQLLLETIQPVIEPEKSQTASREEPDAVQRIPRDCPEKPRDCPEKLQRLSREP